MGRKRPQKNRPSRPRTARVTGTQALTAADMRRRAVELRLTGMSQTQIAAELGVSQPTVSGYLHAASRDYLEAQRHHAGIYVAQCMAQLQEVVSRALLLAEAGDASALSPAVKAIEARIRLLGLEPQREAPLALQAGGGMPEAERAMVRSALADAETRRAWDRAASLVVRHAGGDGLVVDVEAGPAVPES